MTSSGPKLLAGGNPQIPMGFGEEAVQSYLDAVPGWKQAVCRRIDAAVSGSVEGVLKAVKWNTPLYGTEKDRYFLSYHCFDRYVKVTFMKGALLDPPPPGPSKVQNVRYLNVYEGDQLGDQFIDWVKCASTLQGEKM